MLPGAAELVQADAVHARVYTDPAVFAAEMEHVFGRTWIFIGHESEVPAAGDFKTDRIGPRPILMTRDAGGTVRVFHNVCRHRGATLCHETDGTAGRFTCMYHGWTFANDGALIGVPLEERMQGFNRAEYGLVPLPRVASYRGFVFASLSSAGPSLEEFLRGIAPYLDVMIDRAPERRISALKPIRYEYRGNWKLQIENFSENYHPAILHQSIFAHRSRFTGTPIFTLKNALAGTREVVVAHGHAAVDFMGSRRRIHDAYDEEYLEVLAQRDGPERAKELRDRDLHLLIYPNLLLHTRLNHYRVIRPVAVDRTEIDVYPCRLEGAGEKLNARLAHNTANHVSPVGLVQVDDLQAFDWVQDGLTSGAIDWIPLKLHGVDEQINANGELEWTGASEGIIRHQYREWARMMAQSAPAQA